MNIYWIINLREYTVNKVYGKSPEVGTNLVNVNENYFYLGTEIFENQEEAIVEVKKKALIEYEKLGKIIEDLSSNQLEAFMAEETEEDLKSLEMNAVEK